MDNKKIVLVGTGMVGMSFAYAALNQNVCDELGLIDLNHAKAVGEAMDLNHGLAFSSSAMKIYACDYQSCCDADIVVICAGVNQQPGESRLQLLSRNAKVFESVVTSVLKSGFDGIFLVATNPVDIMTRITYTMSAFDKSKVIGTGTTLDTARLRYLLSDYFSIDSRNIHAYVIGEHGDSEFVPWSNVNIAYQKVSDLLNQEELKSIEDEVRNSAYDIAGGVGVKISHRKSVKLFKKLLSHAVNDSLAQMYHDYRKEIGKNCGKGIADSHSYNVFKNRRKVVSAGKSYGVNGRTGIFRAKERKLV